MNHVLYATKYKSVLKAVLLKELSKDVEIFPQEEYSKNLFKKEVYFDVDNFSLEKIYLNYKKRRKKNEWVLNSKNSFKGYLLENMVKGAFLNSNKNKFSIIERGLLEALKEGPDYILEKASPAGKQLHSLYKEVMREVHKSSGFIRFQPFENEKNKLLVGYYEPEHQTARILLKHFSKRFKEFKIILRTPQTVYFWIDGKIKELPAENFDFNLPPDQFGKLWETYYNTTYLPQRKNERYAMQMMPKKYWSWVKEGIKIRYSHYLIKKR
jgi:probable DNA metabolism protein